MLTCSELLFAQVSRSTLKRQKIALEGELNVAEELNVAREKIIGLESTIARLSSTHAGIEAELSVTKVS